MQLKKEMNLFLTKRSCIHSRALKRNIWLTKLPKILTERRDARHRLCCFRVAIDIIRHANQYTMRQAAKNKEYEFVGIDSIGQTVVAHVREERSKKDRTLFFISCYQRKKFKL